MTSLMRLGRRIDRMGTNLDIDVACTGVWLPPATDLQRWCDAAVQAGAPDKTDTEISLRITDAAEIQSLNARYRQQDKATNVLSFPADLPPELGLPLLGDLVICAAVVAEEAEQQNKSPEAHWAHMVVHGCLHLLGYDHISETDADVMEALEIQIMAQLGYSNPYEPDPFKPDPFKESSANTEP